MSFVKRDFVTAALKGVTCQRVVVTDSLVKNAEGAITHSSME